jgi:peptide deformylase
MPLRKIVTVDGGNPVLRQPARPVRRISPEVRDLLDDMVETMRAAPGVGLAAPQVGVPQRLIVVEVPEDGDAGLDGPTRVYQLADPTIVWASDECAEEQEACLSIPGLYGDVPRHVRVRVQGLDISGRRRTLELADFEARVFQHEIDHLEGILFTDRVTGIDKLYHIEENEEGELVRVAFRMAIV